jgi:exonuclease VII small subunit
VEHVQDALADVEGRAAARDNADKAVADLERSQDALDGAVRAFDVLGDVESARERLQELRTAVDEAQGRVDQLGGAGASLSISGDRDWDLLTVDERRELIRLTIRSVVVGPGRGAERITITTA